MIDDAYRYGRLTRRPRRRRLRADLLAMTAAAAIVVGALPRFTADNDVAAEPEAPVLSLAAAPAPGRDAWLFDPTPALGARTLTLLPVAALHAAFEPAPPPAVVAALVADTVARQPVPTPRPQVVQQTARLMPALTPQTVPLPVRRPSDLLAARTTSVVARLAERPASPRARIAAQGAVAQENAEAERSFFDTVFGAKPEAERPQALAYAGVDTQGLGMSPRRATAPQAGGGTAVYDISAGRVTLPGGEVLEAHSGLGPSMDNPHNVHLRMRGSTPPGTYDLTEREALFHGVRALRLNPVGGAGAIYNRNGLLTHTYMLGSSGASNGCISFRNYPRFLQAYLSGEVRRVVVVAGSKGDRTPSFASRIFGASASAE
ncbi:DUF2778 domain-containing protein [Methylobacterium thuringiense]|uniref:Tlde1 domain-containing protein n=1 Tax=Methylobacterium thuringiense TaxID=1003091 RepID=A0ABQ4TNY4_9HYPH|nr:DUF2778 domain-containing protein [Methylobacterium thuringiense]GJE56574.1 hypothetical protein EKPJFOCH_3081 [Methylobacterium thuringiense]